MGGDIGFALLGTQWTLNNDNGSRQLLYFATYWGYKFPIGNNNIALAPYIGPYGGCDCTPYTYDIVARLNADGFRPLANNPNKAQFGFHLGAKLFLSSSFYFDLHCMNSFTNAGRVEVQKFKDSQGNTYNYYDKEFKMFSLMLGLGVQF